ncbi:MAG TPA: cell wall hydrolase [Acidobacteriaceae bacterium]|jgi:hypothetical protein|nr:cell wall hydrolase [Acidobacteriaceae bacterium]
MIANLTWRNFSVAAAALCAWREARGEGADGIRGVLHVIANRATLEGKSWAEIIYAKWQFSSMTAVGDPQLDLVPKQPDLIFEQCHELAELIFDNGEADITLGATHYFADSIPPPAWAATMKQTVKIGHHTFYR